MKFDIEEIKSILKAAKNKEKALRYILNVSTDENNIKEIIYYLISHSENKSKIIKFVGNKKELLSNTDVVNIISSENNINKITDIIDAFGCAIFTKIPSILVNDMIRQIYAKHSNSEKYNDVLNHFANCYKYAMKYEGNAKSYAFTFFLYSNNIFDIVKIISGSVINKFDSSDIIHLIERKGDNETMQKELIQTVLKFKNEYNESDIFYILKNVKEELIDKAIKSIGTDKLKQLSDNIISKIIFTSKDKAHIIEQFKKHIGEKRINNIINLYKL